MIDPDALHVWNEQRLVGYLWRHATGAMGFRYDVDWLAGGFAISRTLPLQDEDFVAEDGVAQRFFANLLPEGGVRERIVRDLKIPNTDFELLRALGGECAGALSILPVERLPSQERHYRLLTPTALARLVAGQGYWPTTGSADERPRLSLAGAQDKCPVLVRNGDYFLPQGEAPSSHILKFELSGYRHLPAYETFMMHLARAIGLPVVDIELRSVAQTRYALITRYDRPLDAQGEPQRLHQEDFCQALGFGHEKKYQEFGGPSFAQCYRLVQDASSDPAVDTQHLLRWQIFNVLAGNSDGHAKNLSWLYFPNGAIRLAPFYDLVCTRAIARIDAHLAMAVGGERHPGAISRLHWEALARECDIKPHFLVNRVTQTADRLMQQLANEQAAFTERFGSYPALQRIAQIVTKQCRRAPKPGTENG